MIWSQSCETHKWRDNLPFHPGLTDSLFIYSDSESGRIECLWDSSFRAKGPNGFAAWQRLGAGVHTRDAYLPFSLLNH